MMTEAFDQHKEGSENMSESGRDGTVVNQEDDQQDVHLSQEGPAASELTPPPSVPQFAPVATQNATQPMMSRAGLIELLHQQLKYQSEHQVEEASVTETRELLRLLDTESGSRVWPRHDFSREAEVSDPELCRLLQKDVDALSLQLRCNLATEDRPHLGRIYLNCFVGEDAVSFLETQADVKPLQVLGRGSTERSEVSSVSSSHASPAVSPPASPSLGPTDGSGSQRSEVRRSGGHGGLSRADAMWVANELLKRGDWQQLTGLEKSPANAHPLPSPAGRGFVPHLALLQFTLFRMRTAPALNEQYKWHSRTGRAPVAVSCHLLNLLATLPFREQTHAQHTHDGSEHSQRRGSCSSTSSSVMSFDTETDSVLHSRGPAHRPHMGPAQQEVLDSAAFRRFEEASAELQAVDYATLPSRGLLSFLINLHNMMVVHGHCRLGTRERISDADRRMFMKAVRYRVGTTYLSLFDVNLILRTRFLTSGRVEPRVHFTLSFGSVSSPSIRCYTPDMLAELLEEAAREYCLAVQAVVAERKVVLPVGFKFFASDFAKTRRGLVEYVAAYAGSRQQDAIRDILSAEGKTIDIRYISPNWQLDLYHRLAPLRNQQPPPPRARHQHH